MKEILRRVFMMLLLCVLLPALPAGAEEMKTAEDISSELTVQSSGFHGEGMLFDSLHYKSARAEDEASITLTDERGIGSLYLMFDKEYGPYTLTNNDTGKTMSLGQLYYLHEFVPLEDSPKSVTLTFANGPVKLNEIYAFTEGEVPDFVQKWEQPKDGETDLVLFSTHGDDEHLFFSGILPYYGVERDYQVQVVYLTNHGNLQINRRQEMLNGLWAVGIRSYPVFGPFGDYFSTSSSQAYAFFKYWGTEREDLLSFVVEQVRRFKPKVAVGHDPINGEYGHGAHIVYAEMLMEAVEIANDPERFPESAQVYGLWDVPKTYLHLYPENEIIMDWDQPLESFGGMTAFEVSNELGFTCHVSQYNDFAWYSAWAERADEIGKFSPRKFGLYRSTVGEDVNKNDFFENVTTYGEDARLKAEEEARLEAQRKAEEEARLAEEARIREEAEAQAQQLLEQEQEEKSRKEILVAITAVIGVVFLFVLLDGFSLRKKKK